MENEFSLAHFAKVTEDLAQCENPYLLKHLLEMFEEITKLFRITYSLIC